MSRFRRDSQQQGQLLILDQSCNECCPCVNQRILLLMLMAMSCIRAELFPEHKVIAVAWSDVHVGLLPETAHIVFT